MVEDVLRPDKLEPDPEAMVRGAYAHKVLEVTFTQLREQTGARGVTPENLADAERLLLQAMTDHRGEFRLSPNQTRVRAAVRRLEFDLLRYLRWEAGRDARFEPEHLELRFGFDDSEAPALELENGTRVRGIVDRVDTWNGNALVCDYKSGKVDTYKADSWDAERRLQAPIYMLAVERAFDDLNVVGGLYLPLSGTKRTPRGLVAEEVHEEAGGDLIKTDVKPHAELRERTAQAEAQVAEVAAGMRSGRLASCPESCAYRGGCSYPSICRVE